MELKNKMFKLFIFVGIFCYGDCFVTYSQVDKVKLNQPNIIIIMADDMGYGDLGFHNNPTIQTPFLDQFASSSVQFSNFYVSPVCAPTRASLLTGRYNIRTGVYDTYSGGAIMASNETTIAEIFKDNGYETGLFGKWHLGDSYPFRPQDQGFTSSVWHLGGGIGQVGDVFNYYKGETSYFNPLLYKNGKKFQSKGYCSDVFTNETISFIKNTNNKPFFAYLSFNAPHTPLQVPDQYYQKYKDLIIDSDYFLKKGYHTHSMNKQDVESAKKVYAMISNIDDNIGKLIEFLKDNHVYDNTIIIFMTDNGPEQYRYTGGYKGKKGLVREGGIHVPFYLKLPNNENQIKQIKTPAAHIDVLPTLSELCNIELPNHLQIDGVSFASSLKKNSSIKNRSLFFEWQRSYPEKYRNMAVISGDYKLIGNTESKNDVKNFELYNLKKDPFESTNIYYENDAIAKTLISKLDIWYNDIMSSKNLLNPPKIIVGSQKEKHTILNRNDAKGLPVIWDDDSIQVRWDIDIVEDGNYQLKCHFRKPMTKSGNMVLRIGHQNFTKNIHQKNIQTVVYPSINLKKGSCSLDAWYYIQWKEYFTPFYVEIEKLD
jgi:arylsulfatase